MIVEQAEPQTFLFADLAGYTALTEAHGDMHAAETVGAFYDDVRALLPEHDAAEIKAIGDAVMLRVPQPDRAIALGSRIICELGVRERSLGIRIGMHTGPSVRRGDDWFGAAVNLAARVAAHACEGEVLLTSATLEAARSRGCDVRLNPRGSREMKNVSAQVELFEVDLSHHEHPVFARDPVCHMAIDPERSDRQIVYNGVPHHFCSDECAAAFRADPRRYGRA